MDQALTYDQIIVGRNATRWRVIRGVRALQGFPPGQPVAGDRIIVLANNPDVGVFNGQQFTVLECVCDGGRFVLSVAGDRPAAGVEPEQRTLTVWSRAFTELSERATREVTHAGRRGGVATATFAQAITCHKAQGSQFGSVLVVDESAAFRDMDRRWLYTAVTRAAERVVIVGTVR
jgi:exodeoxyribonuclease-5